VLSGTSVSVSVGGTYVISYAFNSPLVDGSVGVLSRGGTTSLDSFRIRTNEATPIPPPAGGEGESLAAPFTFLTDPLPTFYDLRDVNRDGSVSPLDALIVFNYLNALSDAGSAPIASAADNPALDTNGDGHISPLDALLIINLLNADLPVQAEGEAADGYFSGDATVPPDEAFWELLAEDTATVRARRR
jgi:hypothetical protein